MNIVWAFCGILLLSAPVFGAPEYGSGSYFLRGEIRLPYGNIVEPVFVVVDNSSIKGPRQRVDYYDGLDSYFYFPKESATFQIVPTDYDVSCFASVGADVAVQNFFPDLSEYTLLSNDVDIRGVAAVQYQLIKYQVGRVNTYNFYHSNDGSMRPLRFHFIGYDELLGSHYDEYSFEYFDYQEGEIVIDVFDRLEKIKSTCEIFDESESGPSSGKKGIHPASAIELFPFSHKSDYLSKSFDDFKDVHGKSYDPLIDRYRQHIYVRNIREITSFNRKSRDFKMQLNKFADMLPKELKALRPNKGKVVPNNAMFTYTRPHRPKKLPSSWNWVTKGAVSEVKDQG